MNLFKNTMLFSFERLFRTTLGFLISIMLTKAYGIEVYGEYAYYFAIVNILGVTFSLGLDDYFIKCAAEGHKLPKFLLHLRIKLSGIAFFLCCIILYRNQAKIDFWIIAFLSLTYIWNCFYLLLIVVDKANKHKAIIFLISIGLFFLCLKFFLLKFGFLLFILITFFETLVTTFFLYVNVNNIFVSNKYQLSAIIKIVKLSFPIGLSSLSVMLFYRLDQMIVEHFLGVKILGIYALSASMILAAGYLQSAYVTSMYSAIGYAKNNGCISSVRVALTKAYRGSIFIGILVYIIYIIIGKISIKLIFPEISSQLISILNVGMLSVLFSGLAAINSQYLFFYNYSNKRLWRTLICLAFNICWNLILIPIYGIEAAVWGYVCTQIIMGLLFNIFDKTTRELFFLQMKSLIIFRVTDK
ncbi:polysaccharide biosynthesis C-terminal domain-containing protein [Cedecea colo]|uniref:Putative O-antigen transporter n=1 Tax=Cedecea colo TaxID=2552946 RepID=A0ABX0VGA7_9ENTR|nr:polysaccharide biosynthesis C-terminal domain-containing protein [Cedecea colo]NIY46203.1 hypothetical protein [Cedecea colo]